MSPVSHFRRRPDDNMLMIGDFEFSDEIIEPHFEYSIVPHVREWVWAYIEDHSPQSLLYAFDSGHGSSHVPSVIADACQAYLYDLSSDERMALHEKKLTSLTAALTGTSKHAEWSNMIGTSLLASLSELRGAPRDEKVIFENTLKDVISTAQSKHFHIACDLDEEQEWEPIVDVAETNE